MVSSDQKVVDSYNARYDHVKMKWEDIGDLELDENGEPKWAGYRTDLRRTGGTDKSRFTACSLQPQGSRWAASPIARATGNR